MNVASAFRPLACLWLLTVAVVGCECDEPLAVQEPEIAVSPATLDLGLVRVGATSEHTIQVGNRGVGILELRSLTIIPDDAGFSLRPPPTRVAAGDAVDVIVRLDPLIVDVFAAQLVIESNDPTTPRLVVPLRAEGGPGKLEITPRPLDFGVVNEGPGATRQLRLENTGLDSVAVRSVAFVDHGEDGFVVDDSGLPVVIAAGDAFSLAVSLLPTADNVATIFALLDDDGILRDTLAVTADGSDRDLSTTVSVKAGLNRAPIAVAVEDRTRRSTVRVGVGTPVTIDGSETVDPDGDAFTFLWALVERPSTSSAVPLNTTSPKSRIAPDVVGRYVMQLRATDERGAYGDAFAELLPRDLAVVLTWRPADSDCTDATRCDQSDLDLHLVAPAGVVGDYGVCPVACEDVSFCSELSDAHVDSCRSTGLDCAFANRSPEWGAAGRDDDPSLDIDDVRGRGPEVISLNSPADGNYRVEVHYCNDRVGEPTVATVEVYDRGVLLRAFTPQRLLENQLWSAGVITRANGAWTVVDFGGAAIVTAPVGLCDR